MINFLLLFALCTTLAFGSPLWYDEEDPMAVMNWRAGAGGRVLTTRPNQFDTQMDSQRRLLKRASLFNKRRGRELFGKRSLPLMDFPEDAVILENRYRRRANELFG